jgi:hypothetical protein
MLLLQVDSEAERTDRRLSRLASSDNLRDNSYDLVLGRSTGPGVG